MENSQSWSESVEAELIDPELPPVGRESRQAVGLAFLAVLLPPLFLGGRLAGVRGYFKLFFFLLLIVYSMRLLCGRLPQSAASALSHLARRCAWCFVIVAAIQLLPLPVALRALFSVETFHLANDTAFAPLSLDPATTLRELLWWLPLLLGFIWLIERPPGRGNDAEEDFLATRLQQAVVAAGGLCAVIGLTHQFFGISDLFGVIPFERSPRRLHYPFTNPNHLAAMLQVSVALLSADLLAQRYARRRAERRGLLDNDASRRAFRREVLYFALLSIMLLAAILTLSRAGIILCCCGVAALLYQYRGITVSTRSRRPAEKRAERVERVRRSLLQAMSMVLILALTAAFFAYFLGSSGREVLQERAERGFNEGLDQVRRSFVVASLAVVRDAPLFGAGLGCWPLAAARTIPPELGYWRLDYAHNEYLQLLAEVGLLGALPIFYGLFRLLQTGYRSWRLEQSAVRRLRLSGGLLALLLPLIHATVDFHFHVPAFAIAFMLAAAAQVRLLNAIGAQSSE